MEDIDSFVKLVFGGGGALGFATIIKWLHGRDNRLEDRVKQLENKQPSKLDETKARQLFDDLNAPLKKDMEYLKQQVGDTNNKLDRILDKILNDR